jgi:hypothetical protein
MCPTGKRQYRDAKEALITLERLIRRWMDGTLADPCFARRAYLCPDCGHYHLTKQPARRPNPTDVHVTLPPKAIEMLAKRGIRF